MIQKFLLIGVLLLTCVAVRAQTPKNITISGVVGNAGQLSPLACADQYAGTTINTTDVGNQSNDPLYLCFGDGLVINHINDQDLTGDPQPLTPPGIGYAFYNCPPTVSGPDLATILTDPCILNNPPPTNGLWVTTGTTANGDVTFTNTGFIQNFFNNGNPIQIWFAPITLDNWAVQGFESAGGGNPAGPCVNVNINNAFPVVYLNEVVAGEVVYNPGTLTGSFTIGGGLPEYDGSNYTITILQNSAPFNVGAVTSGPAMDGSTVSFSVPAQGTYTVSISDGTGCNTDFEVYFPTVSMIVACTAASAGGTVCLGVSVEDFTNIVSYQYTLVYDPAVLSFVNATNINLPNFTGASYSGGAGFITFSWNSNDIFNGTTVADNTVIYQLCFNVIGGDGTSSPIQINGSVTPIEVYNSSNNQLGLATMDCTVPVGNQNLVVNLSADSVSCGETPALSDGALIIALTGGAAPYSYTWQNNCTGATGNGVIPSQNGSATINGLPACNNYTVTVTSSLGETSSATVAILQAAPLFVSLDVTDPSCFGLADGCVQVDNIGGGVTPYSYQWSNGPTNVQQICGLIQGSYVLTVTDAAGCTRVASTSIGVNPISVQSSMITDATCTGIGDGNISVNAVTGGTTTGGIYSFNWSTSDNNLGTSSFVSGLEPGTYTLTISDDNNCELVENYTVSADKILSIFANVDDASCFGTCNGLISVTGNTTGGPAAVPYNFSWSPNVPGAPVNTPVTTLVTNLCAGTYSLTFTDQDGCLLDSTFTVGQPDSIDITITNLQNESCNIGNDGAITITASGGTINAGSDYQYAWSNADMDNVLTGLSGGNYTVTITDDLNCSNTFVVSVLTPTPPTINSFAITPVSCPGDNDGAVTINVTPGGGAITGYFWTGGFTGTTVTGLSAGQICVQVTDNQGCAVDSCIIIPGPMPITLADTILVSPTCLGFTNGSINLVVQGGTSPYQYTINGGSPVGTPFFPGLTAGIHTFTVTDANGCPAATFTIDLPSPPAINVAFSNVQAVACFNGTPCNGIATATASGGPAGLGTYTFSWSSNEIDIGINSTANALCQDLQYVIVSDGICGDTFDVNIPSPPQLTIDAANTFTEPVTCFGLSDGSATVTATGGTPPYNYVWQTGFPGQTINNLEADTYNATITDANGCSYQYAAIVTEPETLVAIIDILVTQDVSCFGLSDGEITVAWTGGNPGPATFTWSGNVANTATASGLPAGPYVVTVTDILGCSDTAMYNLQQPLPIFAIIPEPELPLCFGEQTLVTVDTAFGGNGGPFYFTIDNGVETPLGGSVLVYAGEHLITVIEDGSECTLDSIITVVEPPQIVVDLGPDIVIELGDSSRLEPVDIISALPLDSVAWDPLTYLSFANDPLRPWCRPIESLTYTLTVFDINGCVGFDEVYVDVDKNRNVFIPNIFSPNGDGANDEFFVNLGPGAVKANYMRVFDRWGELLYERVDVLPGELQGWDGYFRGKVVDSGVLVYIIEVVFEDNVTLLYRGDVTVVK